MRAKKFLAVVSLVLGAGCVAADRLPTTSTTTDHLSSTFGKLVVVSDSSHEIGTIQFAKTRSIRSAKTFEDSVDKKNSDLRLMLIGILLIGVVALRGRSNFF